MDKIIKNFLPTANPKIIDTCRGENNQVIIFSDNGKGYALRIKKKPFPKNSLLFEKDFLDALNTYDLPVAVPKIFPDQAGQPFWEDEENVYTLMSRVPGQQRFKVWYESQLFSEGDIKQGFQILGELHNICQKVDIEDKKKESGVFELLDEFEKKFSEDEFSSRAIDELVKREKERMISKINQVRNDLTAENYQSLPLFPTHHDINYVNVLWEGEKITSLIDFDWARFSTFESDFVQMMKLTCGSFKMAGDSNLLDISKISLALESYNEKSNYKIENRKLMASLIDTSSLFISYWAVDVFSKVGAREDYYLSFLQAGIDRLHQEINL